MTLNLYKYKKYKFKYNKLLKYGGSSNQQAKLECLQLSDFWNKECHYSNTTKRCDILRYLKDNPNTTLDNINMQERIGSRSQAAIVQKGNINGTDNNVAVKLIPHTYEFLTSNEAQIAIKLSEQIKLQNNLPFPLVYGYGNSLLELPNDFSSIHDVYRNFCIDYLSGNCIEQQLKTIDGVSKVLIDGTPPANLPLRYKVSRALCNNINVIENNSDFIKINIISPHYNFNLVLNKPIFFKVFYLISELGLGDLNQIFELTDIVDPSPLIIGAECALRKLHQLGYTHGDAHLGNFLLMEDNRVVIHDFGRTIGHLRDNKYYRQCVDEDNMFFKKSVEMLLDRMKLIGKTYSCYPKMNDPILNSDITTDIEKEEFITN